MCLVTCLTTLCCQGALWHTDHSTIHCNLWANLVITELLFIVGANRTQYTVSDLCLIWSKLYPKSRIMVGTDGVLNWCCFQVVCSITAGLLHFSLLSVFCWLCLEGVELCLLQREVFEGHNSRRKYFYLCGYSIPGLVVAVSAAIDFRGYGSKTAYVLFYYFFFFSPQIDRRSNLPLNCACRCWLRSDNYFIWSFLGPVGAIITVRVCAFMEMYLNINMLFTVCFMLFASAEPGYLGDDPAQNAQHSRFKARLWSP